MSIQTLYAKAYEIIRNTCKITCELFVTCDLFVNWHNTMLWISGKPVEKLEVQCNKHWKRIMCLINVPIISAGVWHKCGEWLVC